MLKTIAPAPFVAPSPAPVAPSPAKAPVGPTPPGAPAAHPFARMLKQNQAPHAEAPAPKAEPPANDADEPAAPDTEAADAGGTPARADARGRARSGRADERSTPRTPQAAKKDIDTTPIREAKASESDEARPATAADPALAAWLAERPFVADASGRDARVASADAGTDKPESSGAEAIRARPAAKLLDASDAADAKRAETDTEADSKAFTDLMAQRAAIEPAGITLAAERAAVAHHAETSSTRLESIAGTPAFGAAAFVPTAPTASVAAPVDVRLQTPLAAPDFAQALGAQVSVLAGNGVQRAELHLNPAEMGPVSVQIVVEGGQARVDFGADLAVTRQAIENGLPELASALRDAGLTLTGGGVSQHARGRGDHGAEAGPNPGRGRRAGTEAEPIAAVRSRSVAVGGVDLYA